MNLFNNPSPTLTITRYQKRNRHMVRDLLGQNYYSHVHLDWQDSDHWMESENAPIRLAWVRGNLVGLLATSVPLNNTCWIRLAALLDQADMQGVMKALWLDLGNELQQSDVRTVAMLMIRDWAIPFVRELDFHYAEEIVTLRYASSTPPEEFIPEKIIIRHARPEDLPSLFAIDQAAFEPPWQMGRSDIRQAERSSAYATVALDQQTNTIIGYQLSTLYFDGSHLARLAVAPIAQGRGIGRALVGEALRYFARRGVYTMTVNTQTSNIVSKHVYQRFGFRLNGYDLPVWMIDL
jgi:ribosomal protein S18 acetylase RimI-like enzyme